LWGRVPSAVAWPVASIALTFGSWVSEVERRS
jgi:hypothetical protein